VGEKTAKHLMESGFLTVNDVASSSVETLLSIPGIGETTAQRILETAQKVSGASHDESEVGTDE
jgi:transcription termination factor NusA